MPGIIKHAAGFDDRRHVAQRFEGIHLVALRDVGQLAVVDVNDQLIAGLDFIAQPLLALKGDEVAAVDAVAEEDAGIKLSNHARGARLGNRQRRVFA